ncbi:low molecular weight protein-tyrosine-phosphatase [Patiriisocius sp. Uisw_017]|uniref:low molecular weight protein-tyrosine-phosphatase n=1 Tax=Patiriisocius sp. Uisw_017 TaxID=3230968 RepID=UPI0039E9B781
MMRTTILMVCLGNICRSPLAEGILSSMLDSDSYEVSSAGTGNWHVGDAPDPRSIEVARKNGIDISHQKGIHFSPYHFELYDYIFVMDTANYRDVIKLAKNDAEKQKVQPILDGLFVEENMDVPDPYFGGKQGFDNVYRMLYQACEKIVSRI